MRSKAKTLLKGTALVLGAKPGHVARRAGLERAFAHPDLDLWHTFVPEELTGKEDRGDGLEWLPGCRDRIFAEVRAELTDQLPEEARTPSNRYFAGSPSTPAGSPPTGKRSYVRARWPRRRAPSCSCTVSPTRPTACVTIARRYRDLGFVAVAPRLPAHGTVPAALAEVEWEDWSEATRLALREARRRVGPGKPLHLVVSRTVARSR